MSANSVNNGVKNLRAMFENRNGDQSTSPPSRGRSPNPSELSNSSRAVSKVRASFVAVERPGENGGPAILGLRRASEVSSMSGVQENAIIDNEENDKPPFTKDVTPKAIASSMPAATTHAENAAEDGGLGNILKGSAFVENTPSKAAPEATKLGHAIASGQLQQRTPRSSPKKAKDDSNSAVMVEKLQATKDSKPESPPTTKLNTTASAQPLKAPPTRQINSKAIPKSPIVTQPSPRTPTSPKMNIRGGPAKIRGVMESAKEAQRGREVTREQGEKQETSQPTSPNEKKSQPLVPKVNTKANPRPAPAAVKKEQAPTSPKSVRSPTTVKPRVPTVPGKLPAAATAMTASAAAKHDTQHSPTETTGQIPKKKASSLSMRPPRASTSSTSSSLAKKASRASLTNGQQRPQSRTSTIKPDDGFLARMMRPTTSSRQKLQDKMPDSPPKTKAKTSQPQKTNSAKRALSKMQTNTSQKVQAETREHRTDERDQPSEEGHDPLPDGVEQQPPVVEPQDDQSASGPGA